MTLKVCIAVSIVFALVLLCILGEGSGIFGIFVWGMIAILNGDKVKGYVPQSSSSLRDDIRDGSAYSHCSKNLHYINH